MKLLSKILFCLDIKGFGETIVAVFPVFCQQRKLHERERNIVQSNGFHECSRGRAVDLGAFNVNESLRHYFFKFLDFF